MCQLHGEIAKAIADADVRDRIAKAGAVPLTDAPEEWPPSARSGSAGAA